MTYNIFKSKYYSSYVGYNIHRGGVLYRDSAEVKQVETAVCILMLKENPHPNLILIKLKKKKKKIELKILMLWFMPIPFRDSNLLLLWECSN